MPNGVTLCSIVLCNLHNFHKKTACYIAEENKKSYTRTPSEEHGQRNILRPKSFSRSVQNERKSRFALYYHRCVRFVVEEEEKKSLIETRNTCLSRVAYHLWCRVVE